MVLVMPAVSSGNRPQECLDTPQALDATFLTTDVRTDIVSHFRVSTDPAEWGLMGFSSGGYCATNLAMRNRAMFGSAASLDGYYEATDGPAARVLGEDPALMAANSPVVEASKLTSHSLPIPSFWLSVGTGNADDERQAKMFTNALSPVENATLVTLPKQGHNFYAWQAVLPTALNWSWQQLSPPDLRVLFPVSGTSSVIIAPVPPSTPRHRKPSGVTPSPTPSVTSSTTASPSPSRTASKTVSRTSPVPGNVQPRAAG